MSYLTTRPLALNLSHGGSPRLEYPFILPAGSRVDLVPDLGFACGDWRQIGELAGNMHDAEHRYTRVPANAVAGDTESERERIATLIAAEAGRAFRRAMDSATRPQPFLQCFTVTLECGAVYSVAEYLEHGSGAADKAMAAVEQLTGCKGWSISPAPTTQEARARGPGIWPLSGPPSELVAYMVKGTDRKAGALGISDGFACVVYAHSESEARAAAIWRRGAEGRENVEPRDVATIGGGCHL